jgi:hypothetical protein
MKKITLLFISFALTFSFAQELSSFYATVKPYETYVVKSAVSGKVIYVNKNIEGKTASKNMIVHIDDSVNKIELEQLQKKYQSTQEVLEIEKLNYERLLKIRSKSQLDKDNQKIKVLNLESSLADLESNIAKLKDTIKNKNLVEDNRYIYEINIKKDDYVNPGTLLYTANDLSKGKLEIFVPIADVDTLENKTIYLDGKKTNYKVNKIFRVADSKHISSYKCEIIIDKPKVFSKLTKIEFK